MAEDFVKCPDCQNGEQRNECFVCEGAGSETCSACHGSGVEYDYMENRRECSSCHGRPRHTCDHCAGRGFRLSRCETCHGIAQLERSVAFRIIQDRQAAAKKAEEERLVQQQKAEAERQARELQAAITKRQSEAEAAQRWAEEASTHLAAVTARQEQAAAAAVLQARHKRWRNMAFGCVAVWLLVQIGVPFLASLVMRTLHRTSTALKPHISPAVSTPNAMDRIVLSASERVLVRSDLAGRSQWELTLMRNEPFARHGFKFGQGKADAPIYTYFCRFPWYQPRTGSIEDVSARLSKTEQQNVKLLLDYQNK